MIRTADLRCRQRQLHQPSHNHCPIEHKFKLSFPCMERLLRLATYLENNEMGHFLLNGGRTNQLFNRINLTDHQSSCRCQNVKIGTSKPACNSPMDSPVRHGVRILIEHNIYALFIRNLFKMGQPRPLFRLFSVFPNKQYNFLQQINVKNVHPVYGTGIRTQDLLNLNRHR